MRALAIASLILLSLPAAAQTLPAASDTSTVLHLGEFA